MHLACVVMTVRAGLSYLAKLLAIWSTHFAFLLVRICIIKWKVLRFFRHVLAIVALAPWTTALKPAMATVGRYVIKEHAVVHFLDFIN